MYCKLVLVTALIASASAYAADDNAAGESSIKIQEVDGKKNKVDGNLDEEITNAKLRAESGSKSRWSMSFTANYEGGSLREPMSKDRPNPTNDPVAPRVRMMGDFGVRYRLDKNNSLKLATGYTLQRPFHEAERGSVSDPALAYNNATKIGPVQNIVDANITHTSASDSVEIGQLGYLYLSDTVMYDFNGSKLSMGLAAEVQYNIFNKNDQIVQPKGMDALPARAYQDESLIAAYPLVEYALSDRFQLRTVFRPWIFSHARTEDDKWTFVRRPWTQSFGVGMAITRDVYLYPNFQWDVERWRREGYSFAGNRTRQTSTVGVSATVNVF